jgi:dipeptidyl aminopeptidase/acylaminoacyl peptidase
MTDSPTKHQPDLREMLALEVPSEVKLSPDGSKVAILVRTTNWQDNCYENVCWVHDLGSGETYQVTRSGNVQLMEWLDDRSLALLIDGDSEAQVWLYEGLVGDGWQITEHKSGVEAFKPFAGGILFLATDPEREEKKSRKERYGIYTHFEQEESASALYYTSVKEVRDYQARCRSVTEDEAKKLTRPVIELSKLLEQPWKIESIVPDPTSQAVYLNCRRRDDLVYFRDTCVFQIQLDANQALGKFLKREAEKKAKVKQNEDDSDGGNGQEEAEKEDLSYLGELRRLNLPETAQVTAVSPDGSRLLVDYPERDTKMYTRRDLWTLTRDAATGADDPAACLNAMKNISASLDRGIFHAEWIEKGIFGGYVDGTRFQISHFSEDGTITPLDFGDLSPAYEFHACGSGKIGLIGCNERSFYEAYVASQTEEGEKWGIQQVSHYGQAVAEWDLGTVETIQWSSRDGVEIEGVLRKPSNFDPTRRYPLVLVVHGGPLWFSPAFLVAYDDLRYYPGVQFANKDVLVLKPNYRGSDGRGQTFAELNVNNLGVGDLWDLESAIDHLDALGWIDPEQVGCMGWSQGGYISAFAGLHSDRFQAVSVGAGISDWYTYHISNDIPDFTIDYLSASPFRDREPYWKTAPISNLDHAHTPMLIQHGANDRRVPLSNAQELYRGLKEMGVPVELFIFPGMGHPITRPRQNHAIMHQNLAWFSHYLLGEDFKFE